VGQRQPRIQRLNVMIFRTHSHSTAVNEQLLERFLGGSQQAAPQPSAPASKGELGGGPLLLMAHLVVSMPPATTGRWRRLIQLIAGRDNDRPWQRAIPLLAIPRAGWRCRSAEGIDYEPLQAPVPATLRGSRSDSASAPASAAFRRPSCDSSGGFMSISAKCVDSAVDLVASDRSGFLLFAVDAFGFRCRHACLRRWGRLAPALPKLGWKPGGTGDPLSSVRLCCRAPEGQHAAESTAARGCALIDAVALPSRFATAATQFEPELLVHSVLKAVDAPGV